MAILVTMQVGPVDWAKFKVALDALRDTPAPSRHYSRVYRQEGNGAVVLVVEEWGSHDSVHAFQENVGEEFNRRAGTEELEWQDAVWELAESV